MTNENELISKSYFHKIIDGNKQKHPIEILGEMYMDEMQKDKIDLSSIRYAQGEVYFINNDYEAAIFKWENVSDDLLIPWTYKNIADAHFEMDLFDDAEEFYNRVESSSVVLETEVLLQLFSLYIKQDKLEKAVDSIKSAVRLNPDYSTVTEIARSCFESYKDWDNAIELAVNEAIRTGSLDWFVVLEDYAEQGFTNNIKPKDLHQVLVTLLHLDTFRFEGLVAVLWSSYKQSDFYFLWLNEINQLLQNNNVEDSYTWKKLPNIFQDTYLELISGEFLIKDFSKLIESHLTNWLKLSSASETLCSSSAILAWDEIFPSHLDVSLVDQAETKLVNGQSQTSRQDGMDLYESILNWAEKQGLLDELSIYMKPLIEEYNIEVASPLKIRNLIKDVIEFLIAKRVEMEDSIIETINWNEELLARLNGLKNQLSDKEQEEARVIKDSFCDIKETFRQRMMLKIPELIRNCSDIVQEDSDFGKLHVKLNEEMNTRIADYLENTASTDFKRAVGEWIVECEGEFNESQSYLNEMSETFNNQYGEEKLVLACDFKVLDDWSRDIDRISRGMTHVEKANILLRNNPSQLVLKSAGKLFGSISKNKDIIVNKYKNYIESEDYSQITEDIMHPFLQQLELFEGALEWDVKKFFTSPLDELNDVTVETEGDIAKHKDALAAMRENPEIYNDPLTLFKLKLVQYELTNELMVKE
ncbi:hypothetical protein GH741_11535 [Aquibacillus halophilus]|uniref:Uncharacterized protein n=1 Tax=Aquibacillus halophilus TaxID=930132 RepID=A0A6A8DQ03_9BACI|nr:hypothetical protein [Aquibacillus halophilus]